MIRDFTRFVNITTYYIPLRQKIASRGCGIVRQMGV